MKNRLRIETARIEDAGELAELHTLVANDLTARLGYGHWSRIRTKRSMRDRIDYALDPSQRRQLAVLRQTQIVGTILLSRKRVPFWRNSAWNAPRETALAVFDLAIHPRFQRQGYGRYLMEYAAEEARAYGLRWVRLDAYLENPFSNSFYQALGYEQRGELHLPETSLMLYEKQVD